MAAASETSESRKLDRRRVSCETSCSSNSSCVLQKRKPLHPLAASLRSKKSNHPITQRVLSAKLLRFKTLQNQLNDANYHIAQLVNENKVLKNLQKRQDYALQKYEGSNAQLPQMLDSHQEEIRILQARNKTLKKSIKELQDHLKIKDEEINTLKDQNKHLLLLSKNKNLEEREKLNDKVEDLNHRLRESESTISVLNRKLMLESKNYKFKLNSEITKHKLTQRELHKARSQLNEIEGNDKSPDGRSLGKSSGERKSSKSESAIYLCDSKTTVTKKIALKTTASTSTTPTPTTNDSEDSSFNSTKLHFNPAPELPSTSSSKSPSEHDIDSSSEVQLKDIVTSWQKKNVKLDGGLEREMKKYAIDVLNSAQRSNDVIDKHTADFENQKKETELLLETLRENDMKQQKLNSLSASGDTMSFYDYTVLSHKSANNQMLNQILGTDNQLKYSFEEDLLSETTKSLTISEPEVDHDDKKKLLATLKAIDNGDNIIISGVKKSKRDVMKELFGS